VISGALVIWSLSRSNNGTCMPTVLKNRLIGRLILFDGSLLNITLIALIMHSGD